MNSAEKVFKKHPEAVKLLRLSVRALNNNLIIIMNHAFYMVYWSVLCAPPLTWRPLNFSSGLSTRGKLSRGSPMEGSGRWGCGGGGANPASAVWVGWKLLITHDTWERAEGRGSWFPSMRNALSVHRNRQDTEQDTYSMRGREIKEIKKGINELRGDASEGSYSLRDEPQAALWSGAEVNAVPRNLSSIGFMPKGLMMFKCTFCSVQPQCGSFAMGYISSSHHLAFPHFTPALVSLCIFSPFNVLII